VSDERFKVFITHWLPVTVRSRPTLCATLRVSRNQSDKREL
jgi:hypothetical protein